MEVGEETADPRSGFNDPYNELLSRVDDTVLGEQRSAYGGDFSNPRASTAVDDDEPDCGGDRTVHCHAYALWGDEGQLPRELRLWLLTLFIGVVSVLSLEVTQELSWFPAFLIVTALAHGTLIALRGAILNFDPELRLWKGPTVLACGVCGLWVIIALAVDGLSRSSARVFIGVVTLGVVGVEAAYRVAAARCEHIPNNWGAASWAAESTDRRGEPVQEQYAPL